MSSATTVIDLSILLPCLNGNRSNPFREEAVTTFVDSLAGLHSNPGRF